MLTLSREARIKLGKHAWNVFPLEAFGFLVGSTARGEIAAALPCSKTTHWYHYGDRWNGLAEAHDAATRTAAHFDLQVVGFYGSNECCTAHLLPAAELLARTTLRLTLIYMPMCCPACSDWVVYSGTRRLNDNDLTQTRQKRLRLNLNQRRVHQRWLAEHGPIDYRNGYVPPPSAG